jgi:hypothetical protein
MAIGKTKLHKVLQNGRVLSDAIAWFDAFDPALKQKILNWVQNDQLTKKGVNSKDEIIGVYSTFTEMINPSKLAGDPYNLDDTGQFYASMYVQVLRDAIVVEGDGQKGDENLFEKYGDDIIGLNEESKQKLRDEIKKRYVEYFKRTLFRV